ncbi:hypothetical protein LSH36_1296g00005 [Paralvinella palmiformis]|uniref:Apple domain-containing protein n=1 Tax=Paralvinella palmiformis TaxID=53620 RepID=A0AAD9ITC2_9ANNE|nr:hypothetical protein LSH36_1296g00005 [Paralvinella palmiformis]
MRIHILVVFLWIYVSDFRTAANTQSLFQRSTDYSPLNSYTKTSLSGRYESLLHCILACSWSEDCSAISYNYDSDYDPEGVHCDMMQIPNGRIGYLEPRPDTYYMQDVLRVKYLAVAINLTTEDASCNASSTTNETTSCTNLWDGRTDTTLGTEWITMNEDVDGWVVIQWASYIDMIALEIQNRCWLAEQCSKLKIEFGDKTAMTIIRHCKDGINWRDCKVLSREFYSLFKPVIVNKVSITCLEDCADSGNDDSWGLQEVKIWKVFAD